MKTVKEIVLSAVLIIITAGYSFSQTYSITPNDTFEIDGYLEDLQTLTISQLNTANDSIYLKWKKVSESVPANWEASVCDNRICYTTLVDSGSMAPVAQGETGFLLLHITGHVNYGKSVVRYAVWDVSNPTARDTVTFIMTILQPSSFTEIENNQTLQLFPNPTNGWLNFSMRDSKNYSLNIYNALGENIFATISSPNQQIATGNWPSGVYYVSISDKGKTIATKRLIVQH